MSLYATSAKGEDVEAVVLAVDPERERISLGLKQLDQDPFATFMAEHPRGSQVKGIVKEVDARGAVIELAMALKVICVPLTSRKSVLKMLARNSVLVMRLKLNSSVLTVRAAAWRCLFVRSKMRSLLKHLKIIRSQNASSGTTSLGELLKEQLDQDS